MMTNVECIANYIANGDLESFIKYNSPYKTQSRHYFHISLAIAHKQTKIVDYLLEIDFKYNIPNILRECLWKKNFEMFEYIFKKTGIVNEKHGERLLLMCVANNWLDTIKFLKKEDVDLTVNDNIALKSAILFGRLDIMQYLRKQGLKMPKLSFFYLRSNLRNKNYKISEKILEDILKKELRKENINLKKISSGYSKKVLNQILKVCAQENYVDGVDKLISKGADYKVAQRFGSREVKDFCTNIFYKQLQSSIPTKQYVEKVKKI